MQDFDINSLSIIKKKKRTHQQFRKLIVTTIKDSKANILDSTTETVIFTLRKTITKYTDGKEEIQRETNINYSVNVDMDKVNITDIVNRTTEEINEFLNSKS